MVTVPPGARNWPKHRHTTQTELFLILSGQGLAITDDTETAIGPGDCFVHAPGTAHQLYNSGDEPMVYWVIADNAVADQVYYPDSDKWSFKPQQRVGKFVDTDYYDGEDV